MFYFIFLDDGCIFSLKPFFFYIRSILFTQLKMRRVPTMCKLSTSSVLILSELLRSVFFNRFVVLLLGIEFYFRDELKFFFDFA